MTDQPGQGTNPTGPAPAAEPGGRRALWFALAGLVLTIVFLPVGLMLCAIALVSGVRVRRRARRNVATAPGAVPGIVVGSIGLTIGGLMTLTSVIFWNELSTYQKCQSAANTITDETACQDSFIRDIESKMNLPEGSLKQYRPLI